MYLNERGVSRDDVETAKWFRKAAEQEDGKAQYCLGMMYEEGKGVKQNTTEAVLWYRKAVQQGEEDALNNLTEMCNRGNAVAQYYLALMNEEGEGIEKDDAQAAKWYRKAAEQGNENALENSWRCVKEKIHPLNLISAACIRTAWVFRRAMRRLPNGIARRPGRGTPPPS